MPGTVTITTSAGETFGAYEAKPQGTTKGGLVLIQEIFGVNHVMRDLAAEYAAQGYHVLVPDLFWRQEPGVDITDKSEAEWQKAFALLNGFDQAEGVADIQATITHLRALSVGKVATVGYCLGGRLAVMSVLGTDVDASVSYYGIMLGALVPEFGKIKVPLLAHVAELDKFLPAEERDHVLAAWAGKPAITAHVYAGQEHAFARVGGEHYSADAAMLANTRTAEFLSHALAA
jgi:carboxymethylenebutenolidase